MLVDVWVASFSDGMSSPNSKAFSSRKNAEEWLTQRIMGALDDTMTDLEAKQIEAIKRLCEEGFWLGACSILLSAVVDDDFKPMACISNSKVFVADEGESDKEALWTVMKEYQRARWALDKLAEKAVKQLKEAGLSHVVMWHDDWPGFYESSARPELGASEADLLRLWGDQISKIVTIEEAYGMEIERLMKGWR